MCGSEITEQDIEQANQMLYLCEVRAARGGCVEGTEAWQQLLSTPAFLRFLRDAFQRWAAEPRGPVRRPRPHVIIDEDDKEEMRDELGSCSDTRC